MATAKEIRDAADARLATLWAAIQTRQDSYYAATGRFWQGLRTHTVTPADGAAATPDIGTRAAGQSTAWPAGIRGTAMEMALQIDTYDGPQGKGYQATATVTIAGQTWTRTAQVGLETWRAQPWTREEEGR